VKSKTDNSKFLPYLGIINCAKCIGDPNLYILDGQHRFFAYKRYYTTYCQDFKIVYVVKLCSKEECREFFRRLNDNYQLHSLILDDLDTIEKLKDHIKQKYNKHISNSEFPRFPNINLDQVCNYMKPFIANSIDNDRDIVEIFEELNRDSLLSLNKEDIDKCNVAPKQKLYIGAVFRKNEIEEKRKSIPKKVRDLLWVNKFGESYEGLCVCCNSKIKIVEFHAGHIISLKNGGSNDITNLEPICIGCNLSCGSQNLYTFKNKYFKH
jgi:5-methylcytosine-specific restriction endonuclease McrA